MEQQRVSGAKAGNADAIAPLLADGFINMDSDRGMHNKVEGLAWVKAAKWEIKPSSVT